MIAVGRRYRFEILVAAALALAAFVHADDAPKPTSIQAAVTADGFVVATRGEEARDVVTVERDGSQGARYELPDRDMRVAGGGGGVLAGWIASHRLQLADAEDGVVFAEFGSDPVLLCDGLASNDQSFAISWLERDGVEWLVHGPTGKPQAAVAEVAAAPTATGPVTWCGVTSLGPHFMMLSRDARRLRFIRCTNSGGCRGPHPFISLPADHAVTGFACVERGCLLADRAKAGTTLMFVAPSGTIKWKKPLAADGPVSIAAAGDRGFAVGTLAADGATVFAVDAPTADLAPRWHNDARVAPVVAVSHGRVLVALRKSADSLLTDTFAF